MCAALYSGTCSLVVEVQQIFDLTCYSVQVHDVRAVPCSLGATRKRRREERYKTKEVYWKKKRRKVESIWFSFSMNIFSDWRPQTKTLKIIKKWCMLWLNEKLASEKSSCRITKYVKNCLLGYQSNEVHQMVRSFTSHRKFEVRTKNVRYLQKNWSGKYNQSQQFYYHFSIYLCILFINLKCPLYHN